jgi:flagellar motor protein MotB
VARKSGSFPLFGKNRKSKMNNRISGLLRRFAQVISVMILLVGIVGSVNADSGDEGSASGVFLKIDPGAQSTAMGSAFVAAPVNPLSMQFNPGVLGTASKTEASYTRLDIFKGVSYNNIGYVKPLSAGYGSLAIDYKALDYGSQERREIGSTSSSLRPVTGLGNFSSDDLSLGIAWGKQFTSRLSSGLKVNYIKEQIAEFSAQTLALNWGAHYQLWPERLTAGAAARNLLGDLKLNRRSDPLPRVYDMGLFYQRPFPSMGIKLNTGLDYVMPSDADPYVAIGSELGWYKTVFLRAGYKGDAEAGDGITFGGGFQLGRFKVDYAIVDFGELGRHQKLTINYEFGSRSKPKKQSRTRPEQQSSITPKSDTDPPNTSTSDTKTTTDTESLRGNTNARVSEGLKTTLTKTGLKVTLEESVLFETGEARLKETAGPVLDELANLVKKKGRVKIDISGHTDTVPISAGATYSSNWTLSAARAARVTRYLDEKLSMERSRFTVSAYGPYQPKLPNTTPDNRAVNRRVDVELEPLSSGPMSDQAETDAIVKLDPSMVDMDVLPEGKLSSAVRLRVDNVDLSEEGTRINASVLRPLVNWIEEHNQPIYVEVRHDQKEFNGSQETGVVWEEPAKRAAKVVEYLHDQTDKSGKMFRVRVNGTTKPDSYFDIKIMPQADAWSRTSTKTADLEQKKRVRRMTEIMQAGKKAFWTKNYSKAANFFEQAVSLEPDSDKALHWLAVSKAKLGKTDEARKLLKTLLKDHPDNSRARKNLNRLSRR